MCSIVKLDSPIRLAWRGGDDIVDGEETQHLKCKNGDNTIYDDDDTKSTHNSWIMGYLTVQCFFIIIYSQCSDGFIYLNAMCACFLRYADVELWHRIPFIVCLPNSAI